MKSITKILTFTLLVLACIIFGSLMIKSYLQKTTDKLTSDINSVQKLVNNAKWNDAYKKVKKLSSDWHDMEDKWALFINHHEIDNISVSLENSIEYIKFKSKEHSSAYLSELKHFIDHIPDMETLSFKNIF